MGTLGAILVAALWCVLAQPASAMELCESRSRELMAEVGISAAQIDRLCAKAELESRMTRLSLRRAENDLGYCEVTLALRNDSLHTIDSFVFATADRKFELFRFYELLPGGTAFAAALSQSLMDCDELEELGVRLIWPASARADGRTLRGRRLNEFRPALMSEVVRWNR